jgi:hypothetical protein
MLITCSTCRSPLQMISSTLGVCPRCSDAPVAPIDYRPIHKLKVIELEAARLDADPPNR